MGSCPAPRETYMHSLPRFSQFEHGPLCLHARSQATFRRRQRLQDLRCCLRNAMSGRLPVDGTEEVPKGRPKEQTSGLTNSDNMDWFW